MSAEVRCPQQVRVVVTSFVCYYISLLSVAYIFTPIVIHNNVRSRAYIIMWEDIGHVQTNPEWTSFEAIPKYITKTYIEPRQSYTDSLAVNNFVVSTDIEADSYAAQTPLIMGRAQCQDVSATSAIGPAGATYATNGSQPTEMIGQHPSFHFNDNVSKVKVHIFEDLGDCSQGKDVLNAVYDLGPQGATDLPSTAVPIKGAASPHPNFTKFRGVTNSWKKYCVRLTDATGGGGLNETLKVKSGIFRVLVNDAPTKTGNVSRIERLEDSVAPVQAGGSGIFAGSDKKTTVMSFDGALVTLPDLCKRKLTSEFI